MNSACAAKNFNLIFSLFRNVYAIMVFFVYRDEAFNSLQTAWMLLGNTWTALEINFDIKKGNFLIDVLINAIQIMFDICLYF